MSWVNTLLEVGILGMEISHANQLQELKKQQATAEVAKLFIQAIRDTLFNVNQAAQVILEKEAESPRVAAGLMRLLYLQWQELGISSDMLPELADKEYVAKTHRLITENNQRLYNQLVRIEQRALEDMVTATQSLPDYDFYLENYPHVQKYNQAERTIREIQTTGGDWYLLLFLMGTGLSFLVLPIGLTILLDGAGFVLGSILFLLTTLFSYQWVHQKRRAEDLSALRLVVKEFKKKEIDQQRFNKLRNAFGKDYNRVAKQRKEAQLIIEHFFADEDLSSVKGMVQDFTPQLSATVSHADNQPPSRTRQPAATVEQPAEASDSALAVSEYSPEISEQLEAMNRRSMVIDNQLSELSEQLLEFATQSTSADEMLSATDEPPVTPNIQQPNVSQPPLTNCPKCKTHLVSHARFCPQCGTKVVT